MMTQEQKNNAYNFKQWAQEFKRKRAKKKVHDILSGSDNKVTIDVPAKPPSWINPTKMIWAGLAEEAEIDD